MGMACSGLVPQVIVGGTAAASMDSSRSKTASGSLASVRQWAAAASKASPWGANGRPRSQSMVRSSGAMRPQRAPSSTVRLHSVRRASTSSAVDGGAGVLDGMADAGGRPQPAR